jgi:hypothetical protein
MLCTRRFWAQASCQKGRIYYIDELPSLNPRHLFHVYTCHCEKCSNSLDTLFWRLTHWVDRLVFTLVDLIIILSYVCIKVSIRSANKCIIGAFLWSVPPSFHPPTPQHSFVGHPRTHFSRSVHETGDRSLNQHRKTVCIIMSVYLAIVMCVLWNCCVPETHETTSVLFLLPCQSGYVSLRRDWIW